jgi:hypothetical protein
MSVNSSARASSFHSPLGGGSDERVTLAFQFCDGEKKGGRA